MKQKKPYIQPKIKTLGMDISNIICISLYDEDATIVGAKGNIFCDDSQIDEDDFEH